MTAAVLTQLPLAAGSAVATTLGRAALWGLARYARAPLSNTAILGLATFSLMAASNALYFQGHRHPAPLFGAPQEELGELAPVPVAPTHRPKVKPKAATVQTTGSLPKAAAAPQPIGNAEVFEVQRKLEAFGLFDGTVDGLYGPKTARAIRKFEERQGLKPKGELTRPVVSAILGAQITMQAPAAVALPAPEPVPEHPVTMTESLPPIQAPALAPAPAATAAPAPAPATVAPNAMVEPLPAPAPLQPVVRTASTKRAAVTDTPLPQSPAEALDIASDVAGDAVEALVAAVNGDVQMGPAQQALPPKPQAAQMPAELPAELPAEPAAVAAVQPVSADPVADLVTAEMPPVATVPARDSKDPALITKVQRGLASLGFLSGKPDGKPGEATAKAIRNFEVWNNYDVTGRVTPQLLDLLIAAGADI